MDQARFRQMRQGFLRLLILLGFQLLLGMVTNLWVTIPRTHPGTHAVNYFVGLLQGISWALVHGNLFLQLHLAVGLVLWVFSTLLVIAALRGLEGTFMAAATIGWVGITGAGFNGGSFLNYGLTVSSLLMTVGFVLAATGYVWGLAHSVRPAPPSEPVPSNG